MFVLLFAFSVALFGTTPVQLQEVDQVEQNQGQPSQTEILIQQRVDNSVSFDRSWVDYQNGFGNTNGNYWAGLERIHAWTRANPKKIRFEMKKYGDDKVYWSEYNYFKIDGFSQNYRLHIRDYNPRSTAGNAMLNSHPAHTLDGMQFSTKDRDNDRWSYGSCSKVRGNAGWWFNWCSYNNPNSGTFYKELFWYPLNKWNTLKWFRIVLLDL